MCHVSHTHAHTHTELSWRTFKISTNIGSELKNTKKNTEEMQMLPKKQRKKTLPCFRLAETNS